jgi:hypothetical protein
MSEQLNLLNVPVIRITHSFDHLALVSAAAVNRLANRFVTAAVRWIKEKYPFQG